MIRYLQSSTPDTMLQTTRMTVNFDNLWGCSNTYAFALYQMLLVKGVHIPTPTETETEAGINVLLCKFLFETVFQEQVQSGNVRSATISAQPSPEQPHAGLGPSEQSNALDQNPSHPQGPSGTGSNGFDTARFQRAAQNQSRAQAQMSTTVRASGNIRAEALEVERREHVAEQQALRNMNPAYSRLPTSFVGDVSIHPPPDSQTLYITPPQGTNTQFVAPTSQTRYDLRSQGHISFAGSNVNSRVTPLPETRATRGRPGDMAKYYSARGSRYTGRNSYLHSLSRHQAVYYAQAHLSGLNASEGLQCLMNMIETHSLAGRFYYNEVFQQAPTLEAAFQKLLERSYSGSNMATNLRELRNLKITSFKSELDTWSSAMGKVYEKSPLLQDQLDTIHQHPTLLLEFSSRQSIPSLSFYLWTAQNQAQLLRNISAIAFWPFRSKSYRTNR